LLDPVPDYLSTAAADLRGVRVGIDARWNGDDVDSSVQEALSKSASTFRSLGADLIDLTVPDVSQCVVDWSPACAVEAAIAHEKTYPARKDEYGSVLAAVIDAGRALPGLSLQRIQLRRMDLRGRLAALFRTVNVLLTPVHPFAPLSLSTICTLGEQPDLILKLQRFTAPFDMTGSPTITLPGGFSADGLPIGFQLIAEHLGEAMLVRVGTSFQNVTAWHRRHPLNLN
jgi:amidase